ncbi:hypothetical protein N6G02_07125 [Cupriavidus gilardii]|uniref:Uncharacterized protein n=2 Tax=Pseudomonadota TaxID=1224 RepID=A0ABY4VSC7_9BURK|nr:hypothetical protein [Cupriavidus gilardii]MCT9115894.1 hypothetical protein [Cupriavidus gilardii]QQE08790.1 hypothetical protein IC580_22010 [Cupriavidus sp. ISTL7]USE78248.1 hypothetical protein NDR89_04255 [Cupriavidus gilardii]
MAQQPQGGQGGQGGGAKQQDPATDPVQRPDPEGANTDETVQAEERAAGGVSGSGNTLGDGMTAGGAENVEERKVFKQEDQQDQQGQQGKKPQGPVKIAVAGDEHGDEDATSQ